ncbi:MAG: zinc-binding dehydrogenase [Saprospiraceae bacterium]|nr:zinc-binding dehydrogenase [Saprospiraceae bacterium]
MGTRQIYTLKAGSFKRLQLKQDASSPILPHAVRVSVKAIGLNFADVFAVLGLYSATPEGSFVPGLEFAGIVEEIGDEVDAFSRGDTVMGVTRFGAYTDEIVIDTNYVLRLPSGWTMEDGASYLVQGLTAYYGLVELARIQPNELVLVHSAAGGVGTYAQRIAHYHGATTIGTTGSAAKMEVIKSMGYDHALLRDDSYEEQLARLLHGRKLDVVMECIGGRIFKSSLKQLGRSGRMIVYGAAQYASANDRPNYLKLAARYLTRPKIDPLDLIPANHTIAGFNLIWLYDRVTLMKRLLGELDELRLPKPRIGHVYPFESLVDALKALRDGKTVGKVVVRVGEGT